MSLTWFAVNNTATRHDAGNLSAFGVRLLEPSTEPVTVFRDPASGRVVAQIGAVRVNRDGSVLTQPRQDAPAPAVDVLVSTAVECVERDLHRRDDWAYRRATRTRGGYWHAVIVIGVPEGSQLFGSHVAALEARGARLEAHRPVTDHLHQRA